MVLEYVTKAGFTPLFRNSVPAQKAIKSAGGMSGLAFRPEKLFRYKKPALAETEISPRRQCVRSCDYFLGLTRFAFPELKNGG